MTGILQTNNGIIKTTNDGVLLSHPYFKINPDDFFTDKAIANSLGSSIIYPRFLYDSISNKTYFVFQGYDHGYYTSLDPAIMSYDHSSKELSGPVFIGKNPLSNKDAHGDPAILLDDEGHFHVFYGSHTSEQQYAYSTNPRDINSWEDRTGRLDSISTYPVIFQVDDGSLFLFNRYGWDSYGYYKSTDRGKNWNGRNIILNFDGNYHQAYGDTVYTKQNDTERIHRSFCWRTDTGNFGGGNRFDVYYMYLDVATEKIYNINDEECAINDEQKMLLFETKYDYPTNKPCLNIINNKPYIIFPYAKNGDTDYCYLHFLYWDGEKWVGPNQITDTPTGRFSSPSFILHSENELTALLSVYPGGDPNLGNNRGGNLEEWSWKDGVWSKIRDVLTVDQITDNGSVLCIGSYSVCSELQYLLGEYDVDDRNSATIDNKIWGYGKYGTTPLK